MWPGTNRRGGQIQRDQRGLRSPQRSGEAQEIRLAGPNWKQGAEFRPPSGWGEREGQAGQTPPDFEFQGTGFSDFL